MPLTTNTCKKHGGYVEDQCPACVREAHLMFLEASKDFFRDYGKCYIQLVRGSSQTTIKVEDLFQYFRMRILNELGGVDEE